MLGQPCSAIQTFLARSLWVNILKREVISGIPKGILSSSVEHQNYGNLAQGDLFRGKMWALVELEGSLQYRFPNEPQATIRKLSSSQSVLTFLFFSPNEVSLYCCFSSSMLWPVFIAAQIKQPSSKVSQSLGGRKDFIWLSPVWKCTPTPSRIARVSRLCFL